MCGNQFKKILTLCAAFVLLLISTAGAADSLLINYQGRLTDSDELPITDVLPITFTIYDGGGVSKWSETYTSVEVVNGLFNVVLGSQTRLENTIFSNPELYLGINVGTDREEILPRTLLTSAVSAATATKMRGDMVTEPGIIRLHPPDPCVPPEPCDPLGPAFELSADHEGMENLFNLYYPDGDSDEGIVQLGADEAEGGFVKLHAAGPLTVTRVMLGGSTADTGFVRLFGGADGFEYKLLELNSHTNNGGSIKFFDPENIDGRELLTINCSPPTRGEYGWSIVGFNPQPEPPGIPALELGMNFNSGTPENYFRLNNPLSEHLGEPLVEIAANQADGAHFSVFDFTPSASSRELLTIGNNATEGVGIYGFNPQPEPPGHVAFEITTESSRGPGGRLAVYDTEDVSTSLLGGTVQIGHKSNAEYPLGTFAVTASSSQLTLIGDASAGDPPIITMVAGSDGARMGVGTDYLTEALCVIGNIALTGDVVAYTETKLKSNIRPIENALETISALNGVSYDWRSDAYNKLRFSDSRQIGLLADDVEAVLPELVHRDSDGNRLVAYTKLTAVLIEAIKELKAENELLKERMNLLEKSLK